MLFQFFFGYEINKNRCFIVTLKVNEFFLFLRGLDKRAIEILDSLESRHTNKILSSVILAVEISIHLKNKNDKNEILYSKN
jgi:hypothetical protein